ncbi:MAG: hypothetical protein IJU23_11830 [Proteobacteria bacterium]|nr:hypothetical protein [Pseudomonadota bacterium]
MIAWIEIAFIVAGCVYFALKRKKTSFCAVLAYLCLFVLLRTTVSVDVFFNHWTSPFHIVLSWGAKIWSLCLGTSIVLGGTRPEAWKIQTGLWLSGISVITGIFWAFDAPNWGAIWQWDGIETLSLCSFLCLYGLKAGKDSRVAGYVCLLLVVVQNIALYGTGMTGDVSRHSYAEISSNAWIVTAAQILWFVVVAGIGLIKRRKHDTSPGDAENRKSLMHKDKNIIRDGAVIALAGIAVCVISGLLPAGSENGAMKYAYYAAFALIFAGLSDWHKGRIAAICGMATLCVPCIFPTNTEIELAVLQSPDSRAELIGIRAENLGERVHYLAEVRYGSAFADIEMDGYGTGFYPTGHADVFSGGIVRLWGVDYRANRGVSLLVRSITLERLYELWLIIGLILSVIAFVLERKQALKASEECGGNDERPGGRSRD